MSRTSLNFLLALIVILNYTSIFSQKEIATHQNGWISYFGNHKISNKIGLHTEYHWRRENGFQNWQQSLLRFGLDYYVNPNVSATAGYGWIFTFPYGEQPVGHEFQEHRIWEQVNLKSKYGRFEIQHRYRLEQRFLENWLIGSDGVYKKSDDLFRQRIRYRLMIQVPLTKKELTDNTLFLNVND